jgi:FkbM family methyltransferase
MRRLKKLRWALFKPKVAHVHGVALEISDPQISERMKRRIYLGDYEKEEREIMESTLSEGDRVLEFGSGIGYLATYCALRLGEENVMTVEGNPEMESLIRRNFALNGVAPALRIGIVSTQSGQTELNIEPDFWSNSTLPSAKTLRRHTVPMIAALSLIREHRPTVLICDIEGGEQALLPQLPLRDLTVRDLVVELHPKRLGAAACSDLVAHVMSQGYIVNVALCRWGTMAFRRRDEPARDSS